MSRAAEVGDNLNFTSDDAADGGFDSEGYVLEPGDDSGRTVKKAGAASSNAFLGVNHKSTYNYDESVVQQGVPVGVIQDGVAMVLCKGGVNYGLGDLVYFPASGDDAGVAQSGDNSTTEVGKVVEDHDDSGGQASDPVLVKVRVDGRV